jgi:hypothetical protein
MPFLPGPDVARRSKIIFADHPRYLSAKVGPIIFKIYVCVGAADARGLKRFRKGQWMISLMCLINFAMISIFIINFIK